jgi:hypothetical protein
MFSTRHKLIALAAVLGFASATCGTDGTVFSECELSSDCDEGLECPLAGPLAGHCTKLCDSDNDCQEFFGDSFACVDGSCTSICAYQFGVGSCASQNPGIESCEAGLSCRSEGSTYCASFCAVSSWP